MLFRVKGHGPSSDPQVFREQEVPLASLAAYLPVIIHHLLKDPSVLPGFRSQFRPQERGGAATARNINAAFLIALTGKRLSHPARGYLTSMAGEEDGGSEARFYLHALNRIDEEVAGSEDQSLGEAARELVRHLDTSAGMADTGTLERYWALFFPEGIGLGRPAEKAVGELRRKRVVAVEELNPDPLTRPHEQVLFTSNVLLTVPLAADLNRLPLPPYLKNALRTVSARPQMFWYDHPIPVGIENEKNEVVYGLEALDRAVRFEMDRGNVPADSRIPVFLSISTTHPGLGTLARRYLADALAEKGGVRHLTIYAAAQQDVEEMVAELLVPAAGHLLPGRDTGPLTEILGVDGEYGRHYSFLKAISGFWQVMVDSRMRAAFKFDLDQVFPQEELVSETGRSAFEHLCDPLWGGKGKDDEGREVHLGMMAGALVNEADMEGGLFTPDVKWPEDRPAPDEWVFASAWPQALSTEAEMMARYGEGGLDGRTSCLQRVHVTGGTTGILIRSLRRYRPFTPGWIGRAEDQAYLLSVFGADEEPALRYCHASGFFMRHDKEAFAREAMEAAGVGKTVGDLVRVLTFTSYARGLPWGVQNLKRTVDPFTGCFISRLPVTVSCLRLALKAAALFSGGKEEDLPDGEELVRLGASRLGEAMVDLCDEDDVRGRYLREKEGWDLYYDLLDALEQGLTEGNAYAGSMKEKAGTLVDGWRI